MFIVCVKRIVSLENQSKMKAKPRNLVLTNLPPPPEITPLVIDYLQLDSLFIIFTMYFSPRNLDSRTTITIQNETFEVAADDLEKISNLGAGAFGIVEKMRHRQTGTVMAVKRITVTVNNEDLVFLSFLRYSLFH